MNQTWKNGIAKGDPVEAVGTEVVKAATDGVLSLPCLEVPDNNDNNYDDQQSNSNSADAVDAALIIVPACSKIPFLHFRTGFGIAMT